MAVKDPIRPPARLCGAKTRPGGKCRQYAIVGATRCRMHGGSAPQVRAKAEETLAEWRLRRVRQLDAGLDALLSRGKDGEVLAALMAKQPRLVAKLLEVADRLKGGGEKIEHEGTIVVESWRPSRERDDG